MLYSSSLPSTHAPLAQSLWVPSKAVSTQQHQWRTSCSTQHFLAQMTGATETYHTSTHALAFFACCSQCSLVHTVRWRIVFSFSSCSKARWSVVQDWLELERKRKTR